MTRYITEYRRLRPRYIYNVNNDRLLEWYLESENDVKEAIIEIHRAASTLHRIAENQCNGHPKPVIEYRDGKMFSYHVEDEKWRDRDEKTEARLEKRITELAKQFDWNVEFQGDPRGYVVKLRDKDGRDLSDLIFA